MELLYLKLQDLLLELQQQRQAALQAAVVAKILTDYQKLQERLRMIHTDLARHQLLVKLLKHQIRRAKRLSKSLRGKAATNLQNLVTLLNSYVPRPFNRARLNQLVSGAIRHYQADSINFLSIVVRDTLGAIDPKDINMELIAEITRLALYQLLILSHRNDKPLLASDILPEVVQQRLKRRRRDMARAADARYKQWLEQIMLKWVGE